MIVEKIKTDGLAHLSYFVGSGGDAAVIDPRRDIDVYVRLADAHGMRIRHVLETHRNEDLVSGAPTLARETGARIWHGPNPVAPVSYAETVREGDSFDLGDARLEVLETPGHTDDSLSFALFDRDFGEGAVGVFTGDALFIGDVGRTDFYPDRPREVAGLLHDSLRKILGLGDQALVYPAHGAGSVCGSGMADREFSSLGHERRNNPMLQIADREAFIDAKVSENHYQPPYFRLMERLNSEGGSAMQRFIMPPRLPADALTDGAEAQLVDVRSITAFAGAHLPGSLAIPDDMLAAFAGWLLDPEREIRLLAEDGRQAEESVRTLGRIGFDGVSCYAAGMVGGATQGVVFRTLPMVDTETVRRRLGDDMPNWQLLDVRSIDEFEAGHIDDAIHVYVGQLPEELGRLDRDRAVTVYCGSGKRAAIAASVLRANGFGEVDVYLGSIAAWKADGLRLAA
ncbi:MBL fold metallo-hydrolase [Minwuia thermotolerans]|uniref:MBL fold metallo-hydrolase n=1 Tax=Minwuia thermotolerans TaxID=2056226 RepID=A0A2M9G361_9PROT|nr:MBL fold metallo-hydrolase [Minwuia thermotolerans]PJK30148.1 MBL fold metallo-hydrolase [Minwuia thermotolerans]